MPGTEAIREDVHRIREIVATFEHPELRNVAEDMIASGLIGSD